MAKSAVLQAGANRKAQEFLCDQRFVVIDDTWATEAAKRNMVGALSPKEEAEFIAAFKRGLRVFTNDAIWHFADREKM